MYLRSSRPSFWTLRRLVGEFRLGVYHHLLDHLGIIGQSTAVCLEADDAAGQDFGALIEGVDGGNCFCVEASLLTAELRGVPC